MQIFPRINSTMCTVVYNKGVITVLDLGPAYVHA